MKWLGAFLVFLLLCAPPVWAAVAYVQVASNSFVFNDAAGSIAATFGSGVGSGSTVCGAVAYSEAVGTVTSITDDQSNSYTIQRTVASAGDVGLVTFFGSNISGAPTVITVTYSSGSMIYRALVIAEFSGVHTSPLDVETGQEQLEVSPATDAITSGSVTTTVDGVGVCGFALRTVGLGADSFAAGTNYTERAETGSASNIDLAIETRVQTSAGSIAATWTNSAQISASSAILTLKPSVAASTPRRRAIVQ